MKAEERKCTKEFQNGNLRLIGAFVFAGWGFEGNPHGLEKATEKCKMTSRYPLLRNPGYMSNLEYEVVSAIIEGFPDHRDLLEGQLSSSFLEKRDYNGYGFFLHLIISPDSPPCDLQNARLHASARVGGELCGFMLWVLGGRIDFLEGYPLGADAWPQSEQITEFRIGKID